MEVRQEVLPGDDQPDPCGPAVDHGDSPIAKARRWARGRKTAIAFAAAAFAVFKGGKWVIAGIWSARELDPVQDAPGWALDHVLIVLVAAAALFALVFVVVRYVLGRL